MNGTRTAPGPRGELLLGNLRAFRRDVLKLMLDSVKDFGDLVRFRLGPLTVLLINHPDHVEHVLQSGSRNYDKATRSSARIRAISGDSLLVSNGDLWKRQRRLMEPTFHRHRIATLASEMISFTNAMLESWRANRLAGVGLALDLAAAVACTRLLTATLFQVRPNDPVVYLAVAILLGVVALLASYVPASRASKIDPLTALRQE